VEKITYVKKIAASFKLEIIAGYKCTHNILQVRRIVALMYGSCQHTSAMPQPLSMLSKVL